jgi:hypothetical protein
VLPVRGLLAGHTCRKGQHVGWQQLGGVALNWGGLVERQPLWQGCCRVQRAGGVGSCRHLSVMMSSEMSPATRITVIASGEGCRLLTHSRLPS